MSAVTFKYRAIDRDGQKLQGVLQADTQAEAYRRLVAKGLSPVALRLSSRKAARQRAVPVSLNELAQFTHELAVILEAGMLLTDGIRGIAEHTRNERFRAVLLDVAGQIQAGSTFGAALCLHRITFGDIFIETVHAAEHSGNMTTVLNTLAEMLEQQSEFQRTIKRALAYPVVVTLALTVAVLFLIAFVVPRFADMFESRGVDLPALTLALQALGHSLNSYWWLYVGIVTGTVVFVRRAWRTPQGKHFLDRCLHRVPYVRQILIGDAVARFTRIFGLCISSGLSLIDSLELASSASGRPLLAADARRLAEAVSRGERMSEALTECGYLPDFARRLLTAGEESSKLGHMCDVIARHYDRETRHLAAGASTVIEPILIAGLTGVVLIVALAIFVPMWDMAGLVG